MLFPGQNDAFSPSPGLLQSFSGPDLIQPFSGPDLILPMVNQSADSRLPQWTRRPKPGGLPIIRRHPSGGRHILLPPVEG